MNKMLTISVILLCIFQVLPEAKADSPAPGVQNRESNAPWTGTWAIFETHTLVLNQDNDRISGSYTVLGGIIQGVIQGNVAVGGFKNSDGTGWFRWTLAPDGRSFTGIYTWQGKEYPWNGTRKGDQPGKTGDSIEGLYIDQSD